MTKTASDDYKRLRVELDKCQVAMRGAKSEETRGKLREMAKALNLAMARLPRKQS